DPAVRLATENHPNTTAVLAQRSTRLANQIASQFIQLAEELPGVRVDVFVPLFETVEVFEHSDRQGDVVLLETAEATGIVQNDVRVENKGFGNALGQKSRADRSR